MVSATNKEVLIIRFREDGVPSEPFIRFSTAQKRLKIRFCLSEAFVPEEPGVLVEVKMPQWKNSIERAFVDEACDEIEVEGESGTIQYHLKTSNRCYNPGFIQLPAYHLDDLKIITLVSKWMGGDKERWLQAFARVKELGYSMIHFTPLQARGHSNSPYSIKDQLTLADDLFTDMSLTKEEKFERFSTLLSIMKGQFGVSGMIDLVWNHTACDSPWLAEHPEAGYNLENSPHLKPAYALDELILNFSAELEDTRRGQINNENDLLTIMEEFKQTALPSIKLWEFFVVDVASNERALEDVIKTGIKSETSLKPFSLEKAVKFDGKHERFSYSMDLDLVCLHFAAQIGAYNSAPVGVKDSILSLILAEYRQALDELNLPKYQKYDDVVTRVCQNIFHRVQYERIADNGPKLGAISRRNPLVSTYFTRIDRHALANNGWIWNADPFQNFAEAGCEAYLLREVIVWGDCVKLRYGRSAEDNPWLWKHMADYTAQMATLFDAFRIDNCHSTPIHVAEHLLKEARNLKPNLYVCAELFTGSAERDMQFVTRLGIDSLIREAMVAWDVDEIVRLSLAYGGRPFGSFRSNQQYSHVPHNIFFDCTHDNEPPSQKRLPQDTLSNSAIVSFSCCATGSTFGYDQFIPQHLNIVSERRKYDLQTDSPMQQLKKLLNDLHEQMNTEGCDEIYARRYANDVVLISRTNPKTHTGYALITRCAYQSSADIAFEEIEFPGCDVECMLSAEVSSIGSYSRDREYINGIPIKVNVNQGHFCDWFSSVHNTRGSVIELKQLSAGSLIILKQRIITPMPHEIDTQTLKSIAASLNLIDLNYLLYKCEAEERDEFPEIDAYNVPGYGPLPFCGFEGAHLLMESRIVPFDALEHPLCENIRQGSWLLDYLHARLERKGFTRFAMWFKQASDEIYQLPPYLRPLRVWRLLHTVVTEMRSRVLAQMSPKLANCSTFARSLALHSVQLIGEVPSTGLSPFGKNEFTLSAGLPHFATHHMRCWGRDIFIAFRGLFLHTGRFVEGRAHLLAFAGCCLHGLMPNLLDSARRPRFNARDATWWFLAALQDYCKFAPEGHEILKEAVPLRFPDDEYIDYTDSRIFNKSKSLAEIVQSILQAHANGIHFREWNAGQALDSVMRPEGFQIDIYTDWRNGFIFGGNRWNCGTWMDKMGESELAGNRGVPSTPRDGAAIEIVALLKVTLDWLAVLPQYGFSGVTNEGKFVSFADWSARIETEFERHFYVPDSPADDAQFCVDPSLIKRRGIYKDTFGSTNASSDYQMRPNHFLAMAIAPSLFQSRRARRALALAELHLTGPLGMRTLDAEDSAYRPVYQNGLDCTDPLLARGANYHNGPEWLWCMGFYLRAWLTFNLSTADTKSARKLVLTRLQPHRDHLFTSGNAGLPELTNANGQVCQDSCWSQAWSMAAILDVLMIIEGDEVFENST